MSSPAPGRRHSPGGHSSPRSTITLMRMSTLRGAAIVAALAMTVLHAQITSNPIPAPIEKRGLAVEVRDLVRLPDTRGLRPLTEDVNPAGWARVSFVRDAPDGRRSPTTRAGGSTCSTAAAGVARDEPGRERVRGNEARDPARRPHRADADTPDGQRGLQPDGDSRVAGLRPALHERQRPRVQQRRRAARTESRPDAAARLDRDGDSAGRSPQSHGDRRRQGARRLHDSAGERLRRRRQARHARRDLRTGSATPTACRGIPPTGRCSRSTSA
jgi:hypothetical protein